MERLESAISLMRKRRGRSAALVIPMRGVVWISVGRWPSSAIRMAEVDEVTSRPLEFLRVMSKAWQRRPGPPVRSLGLALWGRLRRSAMVSRPSIGSRARMRTPPASPARCGGDVEAVVHAVDEVDVDVSGWAKEYCVAGSETAGCVGGRVDEAEVGFDFGDAGSEGFAVEVADEEFAEERSGDGVGGAGVEASRGGAREREGLLGVVSIFSVEIFVLTSYFPTASAHG